uniref:LOW QUALITY PROTEIN: microtubule cross-linking factor 1-like n=1 Tax=Castor canadensis TaxID=51338 RepID=A0A8B7TRW7_CASCN
VPAGSRGAPSRPRPVGESSVARPSPSRRARVGGGVGADPGPPARPSRESSSSPAGVASCPPRACGVVREGAPGRRAGFRPRSSPDPRPPPRRAWRVVPVDRRRAPCGAIGAGRSPRPASFPARRRRRGTRGAARAPLTRRAAVGGRRAPSAPPLRAALARASPRGPGPGVRPGGASPSARRRRRTDGPTDGRRVSRVGSPTGARPSASASAASPARPPARASPRGETRPRRRAPAPVRLSRALGFPVPGSPRSLALPYLVDPASSICLSQRLSHACLSTHGRYSETANGSLNQLWFLWSLAPLLLG